MSPVEEVAAASNPQETVPPELDEQRQAKADTSEEYSAGSGKKKAPAESVAPEAAAPIDDDPWQTLAQLGAQLVSAIAAGNDAQAPAHPWIERDPATGVRNLKLPLPSPRTARRLGEALSALADVLKGRS